MIGKYDDLDPVGSVELANKTCDGKTVLHALYASQLYDTFFGIFGQFTTNPAADGSDALEVKRIDFTILNYSGVINVGFSTRKPVFREIQDQNGKYISTIFLGVRACSGIATKELVLKPNQLVVGKNVRRRLQIERLLYPMMDFKLGKPDQDATKPLPDPVPVTDHFDSEFFHRNGIDLYCQPIRPGMAQEADGEGDVNPPTRQGTHVLFPTFRCTGSVANLLYF